MSRTHKWLIGVIIATTVIAFLTFFYVTAVMTKEERIDVFKPEWKTSSSLGAEPTITLY